MKVLVVGNGGREHALVRGLSLDPQVSEIFALPGNPGMAGAATLVAGSTTDPDYVAETAIELGVDLVVVGPEAPLVAGVADAVRGAGIACFGPSAQAARLEGSKAFAKEVMVAAGVPTATGVHCREMSQVEDAFARFGTPYVVKEDGLAAGKGVVVTDNEDAARAHAAAIFARGGSLVVEEFLDGPEVSLFCLCDGENVVPLSPAQDFKRALDGNDGPNTGGMGSYSPLPWAPPDLVSQVVNTVAVPTVQEMARRGTPFVGLLYCGLALTSKGVRVVEFNVRFGDPETQVVIPRLASPLGQALFATATGKLADFGDLQWKGTAAVDVILASPGYPQSAQTGGKITGVTQADALENVHVIHAGTKREGDHLVSSGGRVLAVVGEGATVEQARQRAYAGMALITLEGGHYRTDIAQL
ncbi:MAG: phosphoribosylamine--glycine ligase [Actinomycetaceae bacterium]|nr:phosphoribosylamine--glycine ligase [Actinomycetaceae bacterium]